MKTLFVTLVLVTVALPACAAKQVTVAELQAIVGVARHTPDADLANQLSGLELTQRLSPSSLSLLQSSLPGRQSEDELSILAAQSALLNLPPSEIPTDPEPGFATQRQIMSQVVNYVTKTIVKLPDFMATRVTRTFEDRPAGEFSYLPLHPVDSVTSSVLYRDGHEMDQSSRGKSIKTTTGLVSWGEFGPILTTVLLDAAQNRLAWSHWERGASGPVAVFAYSVSNNKSHYQIQFCCTTDPAYRTTGQSGPSEVNLYRELAPYHGEIAVDPASGAILRITVIADLKPSDPVATASIVVQYGAIEIGGHSYICPLQADALAQSREVPQAVGAIPSAAVRTGSVVTRLNETSFSDFHVFGSESRILAANETDAPSGSSGELPAPGSTADSGTAPPASEPSSANQTSDTSGSVASAQQPTTTEATPAPAAAASSPGESGAPSSGAASTNASAATEASAPDSAAPSAQTPGDSAASTPVFKASAREVLLDVIVSKKNGSPVTGLPQQDFSVAQDGKTETIDFFQEHAQGAPVQAAPPVMPRLSPDTATNVPTAPQTSALYVLLLDSLNSESDDQVFTHQQVLSFLHKMDPGTEVAVFALGSRLRMLQGFTSDSALLLAAVNSKDSGREAMAQNRSDNADDEAHIRNLETMQAGAAGIEGLRASQANARAYSYGARASMTFEALNSLARYLEGIPGRKNLIWFASSFPVVFFPTSSQLDAVRNNPGLANYMSNAKQTANLFTLSEIAVYPVSGAGVAASDVGAADSFGSGRSGPPNSVAPMAASALQNASDFASMEQLAASTGGRAFTTNDIDGTLRRIVHDNQDYYTLGYSLPDSSMDGGFHRVEVKVVPGKYNITYRPGFNATTDTSAGPAAGNPIGQLLSLGLPSATGILYGVRAAHTAQRGSGIAGQNSGLTGNLTRYSVQLTIRTQDIEFNQIAQGTRFANLVVGIKAYGQNGEALNWQATREAIQLTPPQYDAMLKSGIPVRIDLDLPAAAPAHLMTAVYDQDNGRSGTLEIPIQP